MKNSWLFLFAILFAIGAKADDTYFRHLSVKDGLSQVNILSIYQDTVGVMWFGSSEGLNRYNGASVKVFRPSQGNIGLTNNEINELCGNRKQDALYIRSMYDLVRLDLKKETFTCLQRDNVYGICCNQDTLWVLGKNKLSYYTESSKTLRTYTAFSKELGSGMAIHVDKTGIWVATKNNLLKISRHASASAEVVMPLTKGRTLYKDSNGNLWVGTWKGLYRLSSTGVVTYFDEKSLSDLQVRSVVEDASGNIWIGTFKGLNKLNPKSGEWKHYFNDDTNPNSLSHNSIFTLYKDMQGSIWVGTYYGGVNYFNPENTVCRYYHVSSSNNNSLSFPFVGKMVEDSEKNLWICTEGGGLNCLNRTTGTFTRYLHRENDNRSIGHNNLKCIYYNRPKNRLYIGTHTGGLSILDLKTKTFHTLRYPALPSDIVNDIQYYNGRLVILTQGGITTLDMETETFMPLTTLPHIGHLLSREASCETFLIDSRHRLWLAKSSGGIRCINLQTWKVDDYNANAGNPSAIGKFKVVNIYEDSHHNLFFGTIGSGLYKYISASHSFLKYDTFNQKLPGNYCYYAIESPYYRHLMILHNNEISLFDTEKEVVKYTYNLSQLNFNQGSSIYTTSWGETFLGGVNGMASFHENRLFVPIESYRLYFDRLLLYNKEVLPNDESGILNETLARTPVVKLKHNQNNIVVEFCSSNYFREEDVMFEYRLMGFDEKWIPATSHQLAYTNLNPGTYTLMVREMNRKTDVLHQISLQIEVSSPWYSTIPAYFLYVILLGAVMYLIIAVKLRQAKLEASLEFERKEVVRIEELNKTKLRFFTNISHEFRTPLTLIIGQIELLLQSGKMAPGLYNRILKIYNNAWHMRSLISELLDFRKQEQGFLKLRVECGDIVAFTRKIYQRFYEHAQKKHITYCFEAVDEQIELWFDPIQMQKVFSNLLSNAFKYTKSGGKITVFVKRHSSTATIEVEDNGIGIPNESFKKIFERFYQTDDASSCFTLGTGIGLALSKGIVDLHQGTIAVESSLGEGSTFLVTLPLGNSHFTDEELRAQGNMQPETIVLEEKQSDYAPFFSEKDALPIDNEQIDEMGSTQEKPVILIVEDNEELLEMLTDMFSPLYQVHTACNGREGLEQAYHLHPDLVLSDVMMPEMSGKELCYKIKNSIELAPVSVALLTALDSTEYQVEGYMFGADDYITKPFNVKMLMVRCNNLIKNKKRLIAHYGKQISNHIVETTTFSNGDKQLITKCTEVIRQNFDNPNFDVTVLASALCMGRSKLYVKFKEMTGLTPNEYILKVKLEEGMFLLKKHPELNISEISDKLGFSSGRYFSKCFKAFYGTVPLSVRKGGDLPPIA